MLPSGEVRELWDCPVNLLGERHWGWVRQWSQYHCGRLWYPGAVGEQPARDLRAWEIIEDEVQRILAERQKIPPPAPKV